MRIDPPSAAAINRERQATLDNLNASFESKLKFLEKQLTRANESMKEIAEGYQVQIGIYEKYQASTIVEKAAVATLNAIQRTIEVAADINLSHQQSSAEASLENASTEFAAGHNHTLLTQAVSQIVSTLGSLINEASELIKDLADIGISDSIGRKWHSTISFTSENIILLTAALAAQTAEVTKFIEYTKDSISETKRAQTEAIKQINAEFRYLLNYRKAVDHYEEQSS